MATILSSQYLLGIYLAAVNAQYDGVWYKNVAYDAPTTNVEYFKSVALGDTKGLTLWEGSRTTQDLVRYSQNIIVNDYEDSFSAPVSAYNADSIGLWSSAVTKMAISAQFSIQEKLINLIKANPLSWDGSSYFGSHTNGHSGAQTNVITSSQVASVNVVDPTAPTVAETITALMDIFNYGKLFKSESGRVKTANAKSWVILARTPAMWGAIHSALFQDFLAGGVTNTLATMVKSGAISAQVYLVPDIGGTNDIYVLRGDKGYTPFIVGTEPVEDVSIMDPTSEWTKINNKLNFGIKIRLAVATGDYTSAMKVTFS